ncbi:MAG: DUF433 domain-containing protein [Deltaproteobacteria bacterium]|nr:DUF433 domain-containing protein [Deltaproteobacteria bacterium]
MVMDLRETAAVAEVSPKVIRHCLEQEVIKPARKKGHWRFSEDDALFFALRDAIPFDIDVKDQRALYTLVVRHKENTSGWKLVDEETLELGTDRLRVSVDFSRIRRELKRRFDLLAKRETRIVSRMDTLGGEPVFAGTRVAVRHVGLLMLRGVPMEEMRVDFPRLKEEDFELAKLLAMIGPKPGRPRRLPPLRFLRDGKEVK